MAKQQPKAGGSARTGRAWWSESHSLLVVVFVCGAVLMAFEIVGSRILAPTFGGTVFVWGSLIGVVLGALSLGYFVGGRLADKKPSFFLLGTIIAIAGLLIVVVPFYATACGRWVDRSAPGRSINPLFTSVLLFFVPSILLGMVSPFSVRLQARTITTVGNVAGRLYALSTLGSIAGTLLATFWLIPSFGASMITKALGVTLVVVSLLAILPRLREQLLGGRVRRAVGSAAVLLGVIALALVPSPSFIPLAEGEKLVAEADSPYQHIGIVLLSGSSRGMPEEWSMRMVFDEYIESEILVESGDSNNIRIREPYTSNAKYTDMLHLPFLFNSEARSVLVVGGGGGVVPTIFCRDYPDVTVDVVEIDPTVLRLAERYFGFRPNEGPIRTFVMDGRVYVRDCTRKYDIIILDAFTGGRPPFHLLTREFLELVKSRLSSRGVVHLNIISSLEGEMGRLYRAVLKTFIAVFGRERVYVFPKWYDPRWGSTVTRRDGINIMLVATNFDFIRNPLPRDEIVRRAETLVQSGRIKIPSVQVHAYNHLPEERGRDLSADPILTDDYAPVDNMITD